MKKTSKIFALFLVVLLSAFLPQNLFAKPIVANGHRILQSPMMVPDHYDQLDFKVNRQQYMPISLSGRFPLEGLKHIVDTVRLVGWNSGPNPKVTIDGKSYTADILTKISPNCIASEMDSSDEVSITTKQHKIEYATLTEMENARIIVHFEKSTSHCFRYALANENGTHYQVVRVNLFGWGLQVKVAPLAKVLIIIDGKKYSESELEDLETAEVDPKPTFKIADTAEDMKRRYPQYAKEYGGVIEFISVKK